MRALPLLVLGAVLAGGETAPGLRLDQVHLDLRFTGQPPVLAGSGMRLILAVELPASMTLLRLGETRCPPVRTDTGERLALLQPPAERSRRTGVDRLANRERGTVITMSLSPPGRACAALVGLRGSAEAWLATGPAREARIPASALSTTAAIPIPGLVDGSIAVRDRQPHRLVLACSPALAERLGPVSVVGGDGQPTAVPAPAADAGGTLTVNLPDGAWRELSVSWWSQVRRQDLALNLARLELPGGLPGMAGLEAPVRPPARPARAPAWPSPIHVALAMGDGAALSRALVDGADSEAVQDGRRPLHRAVELGDEAAIETLLGHGAEPAARMPDGRSALELARDLGRWRILRRLLGNPWDPL